ncbi:phage tail tape measure protein [Citrobacter sp. Ce006]|uniref:phage tail tape measure protein n=1 Tax=Citrobacter sp. Ce006 TaxID=2985039 RepID=UPI0025784E26|nr:phage tail tape measure protein [Citrobacter sp. Ce006]MDM3317635.1 phage tail tape measure protein [Citrobacter sp. Ce006]
MSDNNLRLQVVLGAVDKLTRPFKNAQAGSKELASAIRQTRDQIKKLSDAGGQLKSFDQLTKSVSRTGAELDQARLRAQMMTREMSSLESPTKKQTQALEAQWRAVSRLEQKQQQETRQMAAARAELYRLGLSAGGGARETARIARETERYNRQLAEQERRLREVGERQRKLNAIKAKAEKTRELRNSLAGNGAGAMAAGVTTGMTLLAPVKAYSESENAANQLAGSMMGPGGKVAPEFEKINRLAVALGDKLPGTTADFQNMMTMLRRQGMSAQVILGGLGESAAYLGVQLQMAPTAAAEFAAKLQDATQTSEKDMMNLMDVIQKGFYAGVDSGNMLQGFSKISSAMDIIHKKGLDAAKTFAPLLVMADQAGMAGESAGNAYRKVFQSVMNTEKVKDANDELKGTGVRFDFTDGKGEFGGLEKMYTQLAQLQKLNTEKRLATLKGIFGDDAETLQVLNIMITKGISGYRETASKLQNQASLRERVDASLNTLGNKWEAATGSFTNAMASIGETVAPALKKLADWLGELASRLDGFVKRHPQLTSALFKLAAGFAIVATAAGVVSLALASVLGPMAVVRMSAGVMGLKFSSAFGLIGKAISSVGKSVIWLGRLMFANPILAVIGLIAAGAIYIWQNWDTLGPKFKAMWDAVCNATGTAWDWIKEKASAAWEGIKSLLFNYTLPGLIAKNWDAIKSGVSDAWANIRQSISDKWNSILADVAALPAKFQDMGSAIIDSILDGVNAKWETLKSKLSSVTDYLPDWMTGNNKTQGKAQVQVVGGAAAAAAAVPFAGMYDSGGIIPRGQFGIVGENGPEIVNGPANVTSRRRTAALASVVAGVMGVAAAPAEAAPLHPYSLPTVAYKQSQPAKSASAPPVMHFETHAPITIYAQPGQSAQDIAREVARQLDERERKTRAKARSNFSDQGGYES